MSMGDVDQDAREKAYKGLYVCCIILTVIANLVVVSKIIRAADGFTMIPSGPRGVRLQTLLSLIIGDIFLAVYALVVLARNIFLRDRHEVKCRDFVLSRTYIKYIMPSVYGVGLIILAIECAKFREKTSIAINQTTSTSHAGSIVKSLVVSSLPWIMGIVVALPLNISGFDLEECRFREPRTLDRERAIICVCTVVPAVLSFFAAVINGCSHNNQSTARTQQISSQQPMTTPQPSATYMPPPYNDTMQHFSKPNPGTIATIPSPAMPSAPPTSEFPQLEYSLISPPPYNGNGSIYIIKNPSFAYHPKSYTTSNSAVAYTPNALTYTLAGQDSRLPPPTTFAVYYNIKEKTILLIIAFVFCCCNLPDAIFDLSYTLNENRDNLRLLPRTIIIDITYWLIIVRAWLLPILWSISGTFYRPTTAIETRLTQKKDTRNGQVASTYRCLASDVWPLAITSVRSQGITGLTRPG